MKDSSFISFCASKILPGVACLLRSSEPSLGSSSLPPVHTQGYSPSMSPVTAQMHRWQRRRDGGGGGGKKKNSFCARKKR